MTLLEKLGILGIRSFSPESLEVLAFERPLTLIVGHNGAGKTMATTGELPPNAGKGQNFVHHPKSVECPEVKGQIRLVFKTAAQKKVLANRSFQLLTTKDRKGKTKTSYKALESVLQVKDADGNTRSLNKKCAEMDQQVAQLMGVSKAILENVVFCHQDDSNWPLGDMAKLKKKFDDLFGATRYSKALDALNALRKEHQKVGKEKLHQLELLKTVLDQEASLREKVEKSQTRDTIYKSEIEELTSRLDGYKTDLANVQNELDTMRSLERDIDVQNHILQSLESDLLTLQNDLEEPYDGALDELRNCQAQLETSLQEHQKELQSLQDDCSTLEAEYQSISKQLEEAQDQSMEAVRAQERSYAAEQRKLALTEKATKLLEEPFETTIDLKRLQDMLKNLRETTVNDIEAHDNNAKQSLRDAHAALVKAELSYEENLRTVASLRSNLDVVTHDIERLERIKETEASLRQDLSDVVKELSESGQRDNEKAMEAELQQIEEHLATVRQQRTLLTRQLEEASTALQVLEAGNEVQQKLVMSEAALKQRRETLLRYVEESNCIVDKLPCMERLDAAVMPSKGNTVADSVRLRYREAQEALLRLQSEKSKCEEACGSLKGRLTLIDEQKRFLQEDQKRRVQRLQEANVTPETFKTLLLSQSEDAESKTKELLVAQNASTLYENYLQYSVAKNKCAFCTRPFQTPAELETLKKHLSGRISKLPSTIERSQQEAELSKHRLDELLNLQAVVASFQEAEGRLKQVENEYASLHSDHVTATNTLLAVEQSANEASQTLTQWSQLLSKLDALRPVAEEVCNLEKQCAELRDQLIVDSMAQEEIGCCDADTAKSRFGSLNEELARVYDDIGSHESRATALAAQLRALTSGKTELLAKKHSLEEELRRITTTKDQLVAKVDEATALRESLALEQQKTDILHGEVKGYRNEVAGVQTTMSDKKMGLTQRLDNVNTILEEATETLANLEEASERLALCRQSADKLQELTTRHISISERLQQKRNEASSIWDIISERETLLKNVAKNISVREKEVAIETARKELERLIGQTEPHTLRQSLALLTSEVDQVSNQLSLKKGERKANNEWLVQHETELRAPKFQDLNRRHIETLLETETELMVIRDLQKYHAALDKALMKYHTTKMHEINRSIRELWRTVYRGEDIDYIAIRSDTEEEMQLASTGQRSYNYRVTMVKDGSELEMRGRCSAGQKVLASIVIRLALAESFCVNCGILALDEPTTNLDRSNMEGLAKALAELIESRRHCSNFQLILITHDEEFVRMLARHQPCDSFFRIKKNAEGYSTIRRADIRAF